MTTSNQHPPVRIEIGGRMWPVETTALTPAYGFANFRQFRIGRRTEALFVLTPTLGRRAFFLAFFAFGCAIPGVCVYLFTAGWFQPMVADFQLTGPLVVGLAFGLGMIGMSLWGMTQTICFDKAAGTLTRSWLLRTEQPRSLQEVVAVQFLAEVSQINLVLELPPGSRVNLCSEPDEGWTHDTACSLAAFLDVPLLGLGVEPMPELEALTNPARSTDIFRPQPTRGATEASREVTTRPTSMAPSAEPEADIIPAAERRGMFPGTPPRPLTELSPKLYRLDGTKLTFAEYWRLSPELLTFVIVAVGKLIGCPPRFTFAIPRANRLVKVAFEDLPASAQVGLRPGVLDLEEAGMRLAFYHRSEVPEPHRLGAAAILIDESAETYAAVLFTQDKEVRCKEVCCLSRLSDGSLAVTATPRKKFEQDPLYHVVRFPGADPVSLLQHHREHLDRLASEGLFPKKLNLATLEEVVLAGEQRFVDFHIARGVFVPMTDKEVARLDANRGSFARPGLPKSDNDFPHPEES